MTNDLEKVALLFLQNGLKPALREASARAPAPADTAALG